MAPELGIDNTTLSNAKILGLGGETGSVEKGKSADLIVLTARMHGEFRCGKAILP